jgi:hypothetical protein
MIYAAVGAFFPDASPGPSNNVSARRIKDREEGSFSELLGWVHTQRDVIFGYSFCRYTPTRIVFCVGGQLRQDSRQREPVICFGSISLSLLVLVDRLADFYVIKD